MDPEVCRLGGELAKSIKGKREKPDPNLCSLVRDLIPFPYVSYESCSVFDLALKSFLDSNTFTREGHRNAAHLHRFFQQYDFKDLPEDLRKKWDDLVFDLFSDYVYDDSWKYLPVLLELYEKAFQEVSASISAAEANRLERSIDSLRVEIQERELGFRDELIKAIQKSKRRSDLSAFDACAKSIPFDVYSIERYRIYAHVLQSMLNSNAFTSEEHRKVARVILLFLNTFTPESPSKVIRWDWSMLSVDLFIDHIKGNSVDWQCKLLLLCEGTFQEVSASISAEEVDHLKSSIDSLRVEIQELELHFRDELIKAIQESKRRSDLRVIYKCVNSIPFSLDTPERFRINTCALESLLNSNAFASEENNKVACAILSFLYSFPPKSPSRHLRLEWYSISMILFGTHLTGFPWNYQSKLLELCELTLEELSAFISAVETNRLSTEMILICVEIQELELHFLNKYVEGTREFQKASNPNLSNDCIRTIPFYGGFFNCCRCYGFALKSFFDLNIFCSEDHEKACHQLLTFDCEFPYGSLTKRLRCDWCGLILSLFRLCARGDSCNLSYKIKTLWNNARQEVSRSLSSGNELRYRDRLLKVIEELRLSSDDLLHLDFCELFLLLSSSTRHRNVLPLTLRSLFDSNTFNAEDHVDVARQLLSLNDGLPDRQWCRLVGDLFVCHIQGLPWDCQAELQRIHEQPRK